jgi:hypothetical protein
VDTSSLLWGLLFGSIGLGFFVYGRRQKTVVPLACGVALMIFPYFVSNTVLLVILGLALVAIHTLSECDGGANNLRRRDPRCTSGLALRALQDRMCLDALGGRYPAPQLYR